MKIFFVWLFIMQDHLGQHTVAGFAHEQDCNSTAESLNAAAGPHRGMHWFCQKQAIER